MLGVAVKFRRVPVPAREPAVVGRRVETFMGLYVRVRALITASSRCARASHPSAYCSMSCRKNTR
jgi:hypothetical protein